MSPLDQKANKIFPGKLVRKDLVRKIKVGANVPVYVLEYLLGKYCATDDPFAIKAGLKLVNIILANNFVRPDESNKGKHTLIDKVKVRFVSHEDKYCRRAGARRSGGHLHRSPCPGLRLYGFG